MFDFAFSSSFHAALIADLLGARRPGMFEWVCYEDCGECKGVVKRLTICVCSMFLGIIALLFSPKGKKCLATHHAMLFHTCWLNTCATIVQIQQLAMLMGFYMLMV